MSPFPQRPFKCGQHRKDQSYIPISISMNTWKIRQQSAHCSLRMGERERERGGQLIDFKVSTHEDAPTSHKAHGCSQEPQALQKRHHVSLDWYFLLAFESSCACQSSVMVSSLDKEFHSFDDSLEATTQLPHTPLKEKGVHDTDATQRYQRPLHP